MWQWLIPPIKMMIRGMVYYFFNHITHKLDYVFKHESRYKTFVHLLITIFPNIASDVKYNAVNITFYPLVI